MKAGDLIAQVRTLEVDHGPGGWPAVEMSTLSALADEVERLRVIDYMSVQEIAAARGLDYNKLSAALRDYMGVKP